MKHGRTTYAELKKDNMSQAGTRQMLEALKRSIEAEKASGQKPSYSLGIYNRLLARYKAQYAIKPISPPAAVPEAIKEVKS